MTCCGAESRKTEYYEFHLDNWIELDCVGEFDIFINTIFHPERDLRQTGVVFDAVETAGFRDQVTRVRVYLSASQMHFPSAIKPECLSKQDDLIAISRDSSAK